jgi:Sulfotransferase domain
VTDSAKTVIWIVSYPKSGNTWVRFLTCNLVYGLQDSATALNRLAPDIHELAAVPDAPSALSFVKTHFPCSSDMPLAANTAAAIYVVRDPADVMLSNFHYSQRSGAGQRSDTGIEPSAQALGQYVNQYVAARGDPRWIQSKMGTWDGHVRSWLEGSASFPVLALRYEDLLADGLGGAHKLCTFLGLSRTAHEIQQAVAGASFRRMREIEEADIRTQSVGIFYKPYLESAIGNGRRFMRSGTAGEAARVLTPEQRQRVTTAFGPLMRELGYA